MSVGFPTSRNERVKDVAAYLAGYTVLPFRKSDLRLAISMIRPNTQYIKTGLSGASLARNFG